MVRQCIDIYFNPFINNTSIYTFNLYVWSDASGVPAIVPLYIGTRNDSPSYSGVTYNQFIRYKLEAPLYLNPGKFYVGFKQNTTQFLNVGVDKNTNSQTKIFYNVTGSWNASPFFGSLMLHPVFGSAAEFSGISEALTTNEIVVYPNPANDRLYLKTKNENEKINME